MTGRIQASSGLAAAFLPCATRWAAGSISKKDGQQNLHSADPPFRHSFYEIFIVRLEKYR
jgi:hypothetical protein